MHPYIFIEHALMFHFKLNRIPSGITLYIILANINGIHVITK